MNLPVKSSKKITTDTKLLKTFRQPLDGYIQTSTKPKKCNNQSQATYQTKTKKDNSRYETLKQPLKHLSLWVKLYKRER